MSSRLLYQRLLNQFRPYVGIAVVTLIGVGVAAATDVLLIGQLRIVVDALAPSHGASAAAPPATGMLAMVQQLLAHVLPSDPARSLAPTMQTDRG